MLVTNGTQGPTIGPQSLNDLCPLKIQWRDHYNWNFERPCLAHCQWTAFGLLFHKVIFDMQNTHISSSQDNNMFLQWKCCLKALFTSPNENKLINKCLWHRQKKKIHNILNNIQDQIVI
jgi:hypothetical protein